MRKIRTGFSLWRCSVGAEDVPVRTHGFTGQNGETALERFKGLFVDFVLLDPILPGMGGMEVMTTLRTNRSKAKFVMRRGLATDNAIREAYALGVCGLVKKSMAVDVLDSTLRSVAEGNFPLDQRTSGLPRNFVGERNALKPVAAGDVLILRRLANGQTLKEIANALGISASSADKARARIKSRMKINGAAGLLHVGLNLGLVSPSRSSVARYPDGTKRSTPRVLSS